ncbi:hypothetical protein [Lentibacillus sediminis]|uniref:hypothetical protein n=1 Tax=Lentibacillus sediminis TaxID=1940529 RepID=UPI000C1BC0AF|nr:hypothetical protein [Lentibacillus sediminis]
MINNLERFIGVQQRIVSDADKKMNGLMEQIFQTLDDLLIINFNQYHDIHKLIEEKRSQDNETAYFWDWLDEHGLEKMKRIAQSSLPNSEELHDLLEYRKMLLELDAESQIADSLFTSIADTLSQIDEFVGAISEEAATVKEKQDYESSFTEESIPINLPKIDHTIPSQWIIIESKSPAGNPAGLLL